MGGCLGKNSSSSRSRKERPSLAPLRLVHLDGRPLLEESDDTNQSVPAVPLHVLKGLVSVQLYDDPSPPQCPYCERPESDRADMMICNSEFIPYDIFEKLMERGWWRTGNVFFQPQIDKICCPSFAIRMPARKYQLTKNHRRLLNRWRDFLLYGDPRWENRDTALTNGISQEGTVSLHHPHNASYMTPTQTCKLPTQTADDTPTGSKVRTFPDPVVRKSKTPVRRGEGPDLSKPPCGKAREMRIKRALEKKPSSSTNQRQPPDQVKTSLLEILRDHETQLEQATPKHKLEVKLVARNDPEMKDSLRDFFSLYDRFQDSVHLGKSKFKTISDLHWGFINSPLRPQGEAGGRPLGTYHMRYYLDGELIMLSVLDILPHYLVSIYFIYNPHIRFLQPGIYTCLREIALIQELQKTSPELVYYNLGFFNDFSPKISYKKQFKPTEILCPITNAYVPLERVLPLLRETRFCRFAEEGITRKPEEGELDVDDVIVFDVTCMKGRYVKDLPHQMKYTFKPILQHYMRGTGKDVLTTMLLSR